MSEVLQLCDGCRALVLNNMCAAVLSSGPPASVPKLQLWQCHSTRLQLGPPGPEHPPPYQEWVRVPDCHNLSISNHTVCVTHFNSQAFYCTCIRTENAVVLHKGSKVKSKSDIKYLISYQDSKSYHIFEKVPSLIAVNIINLQQFIIHKICVMRVWNLFSLI